MNNFEFFEFQFFAQVFHPQVQVILVAAIWTFTVSAVFDSKQSQGQGFEIEVDLIIKNIVFGKGYTRHGDNNS